MLPATLAQDVMKQVRHYLEATFPMRRPALETALREFFLHPDNGLFKGPWLQLQRPFRVSADPWDHLFSLPIPFTPFKHQHQAWSRLSTKNRSPRPTVITTGTGSGKTECFLYPILDHCLREHQAGRRDGIKAIILYPMNALAADQAGRFAKEIMTTPGLSDTIPIDGHPHRRARIRVGLYTGRMRPGQEDRASDDDGSYREVCQIPGTDANPQYTAITHRSSLQEDPPDILLSNYKMLDYLLLRPRDQRIWRHNHPDATRLRYLVLDELHTYDGAQGADVACLIRRLKERLDLASGELCVVGTSATVASGGDDEKTMDPLDRLCTFASSLFEETIGTDAVIGEDRCGAAELIRNPQTGHYPEPAACEPRARESAMDYARRVAAMFVDMANPAVPDPHPPAPSPASGRGGDEVRWQRHLAHALRHHPLFHHLLFATESGPRDWPALIRRLGRDDLEFRGVGDFDARSKVLAAFLALLALAREQRAGRPFPLIPTQVQLWLRELRRIGLEVNENPHFTWLDEPLPETRRQLPVVHCTECGEVAWAALIDPDRTSEVQQHVQGFVLDDDVKRLYQGWGFEHLPSERLVILSPWPANDDPLPGDGPQQRQLEATRHYLAPRSLVVRVGPGLCPLSGEQTIPVKLSHETRRRERDQKLHGLRRCPHCQELDSLMFIGSRAATLSSVAIDEMFGSTLNQDPKLLAFTDSVQDASHRAGFFSARTYHFTFRTALQHLIDDAPAGLPLPEVGERLLAYWSTPEIGRPGSLRETLATLMPPDLREYQPYLDYRNGVGEIPTRLRRDIVTRLSWQATSEFGLMLTHGRTMEMHGSAALGWDPARIHATLTTLRDHLPGISPGLAGVDDLGWLRWQYGLLQRMRERGALYHPYLDSLARQNYWGKFPFGRVVADRETHPPAGRYRPRLIVTQPDRQHDHLLAGTGKAQLNPWFLVWTRRILGVPGVDDASLLDVLDAWRRAATGARLLRQLHTDGDKHYLALDASAARLHRDCRKFACETTHASLFRPAPEADCWQGAPSLAYRDDQRRYHPADLNERERYYSARYRKGALRRVFAFEHTGLLNTVEREKLELDFHSGQHADDPNVLTATSTLEMGIDIGDLSATMLCAIPPSVASYLQRIGRAGRSTGTALILSVINQRPHDLFFYARPGELLRGQVDPPGCWLDASAVLGRQYLAFCCDQAVREAALHDLPRTGQQLETEVLDRRAGHIPDLLVWITAHEARLQDRFLARFTFDQVHGDTRGRFQVENQSERIRERIERACQEFRSQRLLIHNARQRLNEQRRKLDEKTDPDLVQDIERELRILRARGRKLGEVSALEVLIEHGLLPNYAFPERGVRFSGSTYNQYRKRTPPDPLPRAGEGGEESPFSRSREKGLGDEGGNRTIELIRSGRSALRDLAPANFFYTHSHRFQIQQLEVGSRAHPLLETWAVCGQCGHLRIAQALEQPEATPACPQCGHDGPDGQRDRGQHRDCLPFHRSQAVSYMEYYDSLSGDQAEERDQGYYQTFDSFDHTVAQASGAVADEQLPFGIEYRAAIRLRELNTGYFNQETPIPVGRDRRAAEGFEICAGCGVVANPGQDRGEVRHRSSCPGRTRTRELERAGKSGDAYQWHRAWLYRELRSEAIRLLLPELEEDDLITLEAAIMLGLRLRFQGSPAHLDVRTQQVPDPGRGVVQRYLVLMDAVPGGTGFLKTLFQETDAQDRPGEGIMAVMRRALAAMETCECRIPRQDQDDPDGCYRCLRNYQSQHRAGQISREGAIRLLTRLIAAGERRRVRERLDNVDVSALFGSVLEKRFMERLRDWVTERGGQWHEALIDGARGFRFVVGRPERAWALQLQPLLNSAHGVAIPCQPDFLLSCDDPAISPLAIFADGFEYHVQPDQSHSRLADDVAKRRAILASGRYRVWSLSWDDLEDPDGRKPFGFLEQHIVDNMLRPYAKQFSQGRSMPAIDGLSHHPWQQLQAFLACPDTGAWQQLARRAAGFFVHLMAAQGHRGSREDLDTSFTQWRSAYNPPALGKGQGDWCWLTRLIHHEDILAYAPVDDALLTGDIGQIRAMLRLDDDADLRAGVESYKLRWRRFLAAFNFFQFLPDCQPFTTSEVIDGSAPELSLHVDRAIELSAEWQACLDQVTAALTPVVEALAGADRAVPEVEHYADEVGDDYFAELAWPDAEPPLAVLWGDQAHTAGRWRAAGWRVVTEAEITEGGMGAVVAVAPTNSPLLPYNSSFHREHYP